ncbi:hypothetical protein M422DRAFT_246139 [Sphaerobolus stellatus SS14]|nr:hypothetical protein M422DRAFT_246139 [Sphaerobolus stellatus SS14]
MLEGPTNHYHPEAALKPTIKEILALTDITQFNGAEDALIRIMKNPLCSHFFSMVNMAAKLLIEASCPAEARMFRDIFQRSLGYTNVKSAETLGEILEIAIHGFLKNEEPPTELVGFIALLKLVVYKQEETLERTNVIGDVCWCAPVSEWFHDRESQQGNCKNYVTWSNFIKAAIVKEDGYKDATNHLSLSPDGKVPTKSPCSSEGSFHSLSKKGVSHVYLYVWM